MPPSILPQELSRLFGGVSVIPLAGKHTTEGYNFPQNALKAGIMAYGAG
ncbi:hypothetical protein GFS31_03230 [Leptolyngbya sp. BL0902]|nr:hypothetical protein [Leptolyngbya sp. BL0902]QQE63655.1 hypothetical protein GFS31_03230 [Leptolyngbya sp. BL0902]